MKSKQIMKFMLIAAFTAISSTFFAQKPAKLLKSESSVTIAGTSTLHDWEEKALQFECELQVYTQGNKLVNVDKGLFKCLTKSIKSEHDLMDKKTWEALKSTEHPEMVFTPKSVDNLVSDKETYTCTVTGDLMIAGVTKTVTIPISGSLKSNRLTIKGSTEVNMPDYGVKPPTAMMGSIKTGPKVTISVFLSFII